MRGARLDLEPSERVGEWGFSVDLENKQYPLIIAERRLRYKGFECQYGAYRGA